MEKDLSQDTFEVESLSETLTLCRFGERELYLLGTAHISAKSADEIETSLEKYEIDAIGIELDQERYNSLQQKDRWESLDLLAAIRTGRAPILMVNLALSGMQKRMGKHLNVVPGVEMRRAIELSEERGAQLTLIDRSLRVTFLRAWRLSSVWQQTKIIATVFAATFDRSKIEEEELEQLKSGNSLDQLFEAMGVELPSIKRVLIDERDLYLANKLYSSGEKKILAVVGAGHVPGMIRQLKRIGEGDLPENQKLEEIPEKKGLKKIFYFLFSFVLIGLIVFTYLVKGSSLGNQMTMTWFLRNAIFAGVATLFALPSPFTVIVAAIASPITSLLPIGVGIFSGLTQTFFCKPRVRDLENLLDDAGGLKGWYSNRVTRIFLVIIFSSIGSTVGSLTATAEIFGQFFS